MNESLNTLIKEMPKIYKYAGVASIVLSVVIFLGVDHLTTLRYRHQGDWFIKKNEDSTILVLTNSKLSSDKNFYEVSMLTANSAKSFSVVKTFGKDSSVFLMIEGSDFKKNDSGKNAEFVLKEETFITKIARFLISSTER